MAETPKTPKDLRLKRLRAKTEEGDDYQEYMQAVLRQAKAYPEKLRSVRTH